MRLLAMDFVKLVLVAWGLVLFAAEDCRAAGEFPVLTRVADIRILSREQAAKAARVKVRGVITVRSPGGFFLDNDNQGIWVDLGVAKNRGVWKAESVPSGDYTSGSLVEVEGVTDATGYSPQVLPVRIVRLGPADLPEPHRLSMERLLSGSEDCQWVEIEGVIQDAGRSEYSKFSEQAILDLAVEGHFCRVLVFRGEEIDPTKWVDARVRIRGAFGPQVNLRSEVAGLQIFIEGTANIEVVTPPPDDPFLSPRVALNQLLPFSPNEAPGHRKVTRGIVTFAFPGRFFFLQDGATGVKVESSSTRVKVGDEVEVAGFVTTVHTLASLRGAVVRVLGRQPLPAPAVVGAERLLHPRLRSVWTGEADEDCGGRRVRLKGRLLRLEKGGNEAPPGLMIEADGTAFSALLPLPVAMNPPASWVEGAELELTGTCELSFKTETPTRSSVSQSIAGFRVWLPSPQDVRVLRTPSWWTPQRLVLALGGTVAVLLLALAWVLLLRREVGRRGTLLGRELSARRATKLEFDTTLRERTRLANDLHDTLEQTLTGLSLQLQAAELFQTAEPVRSAHHLHLAQQFLDRSREDVHRTVWDLRAHGLGGLDLVEALRERMRLTVSGTEVRIRVDSEGVMFPLPDFIAGNLLLLAQEAITNALKHAAACNITACVVFQEEGVALRVVDDGVGFDPGNVPGHREGHFGLQGMRERVKRLGGKLEIASVPGEGTRIEVHVPAAAFGGLSPLWV